MVHRQFRFSLLCEIWYKCFCSGKRRYSDCEQTSVQSLKLSFISLLLNCKNKYFLLTHAYRMTPSLLKWQIDIHLPVHNFAIKVRNTKITPQYSYHKHSKLYKLKLLSRHIYGTMGYVDKIGKSGFWGSMWFIFCVWQRPQWLWT